MHGLQGFIEGWRSRINILWDIYLHDCPPTAGTSGADARRIPKDLDRQIAETKARMFSADWLAARDAEGGDWTNSDRYAAQELHKRLDPQGFNRTGFLCQIVAAFFHNKSGKQLREMRDKVGRERIMVMHGTEDNMITVPHAYVLLKELGGDDSGVEKHIFEGKGHGLPMEERERMREIIGDFVQRTEAMR